MEQSDLLRAAPRSPELMIERVEFLLASHALARPIPLACGVLTHRSFGLVRVRTRGGLTGLGETSVNFPPWCIHERRATIEDGLATLVVGRNAMDLFDIWQGMIAATRPFTRIWAEGAILQAISGIDMALWDIAGKALNLPLHALLGAKRRDRIECYAVGLDAADPGADAVRLAESKGYTKAKMRIGFDKAEDLRKARAMRAAVGADFGMMIDANQAYDRDTAAAMMADLRPLDLRWLEEPVLSDDRQGYAALRAQFPDIPLAWGENCCREAEVAAFAGDRLVDYVMPDPCRSGGITGATAMVRAAAARGLPFSPHHYGSDLGFAACLHMAAVEDSFDVMLRDEADVPLRGGLYDMPFEVAGGAVGLPAGPGLGVTLNETELAKSAPAF